ncbi:lipopolysaccharide transport periplasmic protein LptA [Thioalkalivibrio sp.]|uniref:lipopolysaccharide transport periplasmic protein LptA n=1 Tax=Thioalkalivibrio sp. TaxID=2093813 RepID=UPI003563C657
MNQRTLPLRIAAGALRGLLLACLPAILAAQTPTLPVQITADSAEMDERRGIGTYTGDVVVTHGDMTLWADRIVIHAPDRRPTRMEAQGKPVRAEAPDADNQPRVATSLEMEYHLEDEVLVLLGEARVQTLTEDARGERIRYDLAQDVIRIEGTPEERVRITIQPEAE